MEQQGRRRFLRNAFVAAAGIGAAGLPLSRALAQPAFTPATPALPIQATSGSIPKELMKRALASFASHGVLASERRFMGIVDFSAASAAPRFHLLNRENGQLNSLLVAHGRGSDPEHSGWVQSFSNMPGSAASSSGTYLTGPTYIGQHGLSRRLIGLDAENSEAAERAIVIHQAWYVSEAMARDTGKIGRSEGCFAFSDYNIDEVLQRLPEGSLIYADKV
jgi:L,D-transpeptidase catalytic domain